jgi:hypothetical protein
VLLEHLPGDSAYKTAVRDSLTEEQLAAYATLPRQGHGPWSHEAMVLAAAVDQLQAIAYILIRSRGGEAKPPEPYPRPGVKARRSRRLTSEGHAYLQRLAANQGATERPMLAVGSPPPPS